MERTITDDGVIPESIRASIEEHVDGDAPLRITSVRRVGGGCISPAARIDAADGSAHFVKWAERGTPERLFPEEAASLERIARTATVRVPRVRASHAQWLVLEWLEPGTANRGTWPVLGRELAALHRHQADSFGGPADNFIGPLPQSNTTDSSWMRFWGEARLVAQWQPIADSQPFDAADRRCFDRLMGRLDPLLAAGDAEGPSLLHGDLWSGNAHVMANGHAALIDPSSYNGHREVDLAMAALFGGFGPEFFEAYAEVWPLQPGSDVRRDLYQLYYLLVHVRLFGGSYVENTRSILRRYGH